METLPLFPCYIGETNEIWRERFQMQVQLYVALGCAITLGACGRQRQPEPAPNRAGAPVLPAPSAPPAVSNSAPPGVQPQKAIIDPKSTEAAVEVVHRFADLLNNRKFDEAYMLLGPGAGPRAEFDRHFSDLHDLKVAVGRAGAQEGAAGSIYLSVPLSISGSVGGARSSRSATAIVRRVNDVPGSTEAERHWHIERIDWAGGV
jgi:hypothetical protein